jgi:hypothetical protein
MKTKPTYFILNEAEGDRRHIATIVCKTDEELNAKITQALEAHFDYEVTEVNGNNPLTIDQIRNTHAWSLDFEVLVKSEIYEDDQPIGEDDEDSRQIEILETYFY